MYINLSVNEFPKYIIYLLILLSVFYLLPMLSYNLVIIIEYNSVIKVHYVYVCMYLKYVYSICIILYV